MANLTPLSEMTIKQQKWLAFYISTGNATEAAMKAYDCKDRHDAANIGYENVKKLDIQTAMEQAGLTTHKLFQVHKEGLDANRVVGAMKGSNATAADGDFIEVPDYAVRHKYLETAYKLKHILVERQEVSGPDGEPIQYKIITGTGYIPTGVIVDATPERSDTPGQPPVQGLSMAQESTQDDNGDIRTSETIISS